MPPPSFSSSRGRSKAAAPRRSVGRTVLAAAAATLGLMTIYSCSLIVSTNDTQCQSNSDCTSFAAGATCDPMKHVCVPPGGTSSSSGTSTGSSSGASCNVDGGIDGGGCYSCPPMNDSQFLNACATGCIPFNNGRVKGLLDGGALPSLPMPGPDGGM